MIDRPDWGAATDGPRKTPGTALVPSTHSDGDHETSGVDQDDALATLDADDTANIGGSWPRRRSPATNSVVSTG